MAEVDFIGALHRASNRDYLARVVGRDKAADAEVALRFDQAYWDGDRHAGYGGYRYDGRWRVVAEAMVEHYGLSDGASILDVGCGKGFLLHEFAQLLPGSQVVGLDLSEYALRNAQESVARGLTLGDAAQLPFPDDHFDLVISINTLHNLLLPDLWNALREIQRVGRGTSYLTVEAYRDEREKVNLMYWQLTCRAFHKPEEWRWLFRHTGYQGDFSFIYFE
ncbi:class I SAM-dependent methyltransferase [Endothiovibrio diazotrophicus]